jgi:hypothetical protein
LAPDTVLFSVFAQKIKVADASAWHIGDHEVGRRVVGPVEGYIIHDVPAEDEPLINLCQTDFEKLQEKFKGVHKRTEAEKLRALIEGKLQAMMKVNKSCIVLS